MKQSNSRNSAFQLTASQGGWPHLAGWPLSVPYFNSQPHKEADKDVIVPSRPIWYFNSQPHKEADWWPGKRVMWWRWFQLTASQGGWRVTRSWKTSWLAISTHSLTRRLTIFALSEDHCMCISTHSLTRRLTEENQRILCERVFQLTASQGGWPASIKVIAVGAIISTHSLTRRLTIRYTIVNRCVLISTHSLTRRLTGNSSYILSANYISTHSLTRRLTTSDTILDIVKSDFNSQPHKEADWSTYTSKQFWDYFNSQPHKEADDWHAIVQSSMISISTHSLTRRLTVSPYSAFFVTEISTHSLTRRLTPVLGFCTLLHHFNSQPHKEADLPPAPWYDGLSIFQLTASQGGWPGHILWRISEFLISTHSLTRRLTEICHITRWIWRYFNSQPHKEADWSSLSDIRWIYISTHSLTRRLTFVVPGSGYRPYNFNSQPHKEADPWLILLIFIIIYFNSQPHKEADRNRSHRGGIWYHFNSQPHKEADRIWTYWWYDHAYFNSQPHKEADTWYLLHNLTNTLFQLTASQGGWRVPR